MTEQQRKETKKQKKTRRVAVNSTQEVTYQVARQ